MFGTGDIITDDGLNEIYYDFIREKIKERFYKKNGLKDGIFQRFFENGKLLEEGKYKDDKKHGDWKKNNINEEIFIHGHQYGSSFSGVISSFKGKYKDDKKNSVWTYILLQKSFTFSLTKQYVYKLQGKYKNGKKEGLWKTIEEGCILSNKNETYWNKYENERLEHEILFEYNQKKIMTLFLIGETIIYDFGSKKIKVKKNNKKEEKISKKEIEMKEKYEEESRELIRKVGSGLLENYTYSSEEPVYDGTANFRIGLWKREVFEKKYPEKIHLYDKF